MRYRFLETSVTASARDVNNFMSAAREIKYHTFMRYADPMFMQEWMQGHHYGRKWALYLKGDWSVTYYRGIYRGCRCVAMRWSGIEHFFTGPRVAT